MNILSKQTNIQAEKDSASHTKMTSVSLNFTSLTCNGKSDDAFDSEIREFIACLKHVLAHEDSQPVRTSCDVLDVSPDLYDNDFDGPLLILSCRP